MNNSKKIELEKRITIALVVIFGLSLLYSKTRIEKTATTSPQEDTAKFNLSAAKEKLLNFGKGANALTVDEAVRDPMKKPPAVLLLERQGATGGFGEEAKKTEEFTLEGVIWGGKENLAIISGKVVSEGQMIDNAKVLSISSDKVIILKDGSQIELKR